MIRSSLNRLFFIVRLPSTDPSFRPRAFQGARSEQVVGSTEEQIAFALKQAETGTADC